MQRYSKYRIEQESKKINEQKSVNSQIPQYQFTTQTLTYSLATENMLVPQVVFQMRLKQTTRTEYASVSFSKKVKFR